MPSGLKEFSTKQKSEKTLLYTFSRRGNITYQKYMNKCSKFLVLKEMQTKVTTYFSSLHHFAKYLNTGKVCEATETLSITGMSVNRYGKHVTLSST